MTINFQLNGKETTIEVEPEEKGLWMLRERLGLTGTKFGCGIGQCGVCTIHIDDNPVKSCSISAATLDAKKVVTIEGLKEEGFENLIEAWRLEEVPQCGYCQSGQMMQAAALLKHNRKPTREEIIQHMDSVLCRCGTYYRIIKAIQKAV